MKNDEATEIIGSTMFDGLVRVVKFFSEKQKAKIDKLHPDKSVYATEICAELTDDLVNQYDFNSETTLFEALKMISVDLANGKDVPGFIAPYCGDVD